MEWLKTIAMYLLLFGLLLEMIEDTKYYKFVKWVAGVILLLQFVRPFAQTQNLWERFQASFLSFDYAMGAERVLEEIYSAGETSQQTVLKTYQEAIYGQIEEILKQYSLELVQASADIGENGEIQKLSVLAAYRTGEEENPGTGRLVIPTVVPVQGMKPEEKEQKKSASPMELYIRDILAEFYRMDANKIEVGIKEAVG